MTAALVLGGGFNLIQAAASAAAPWESKVLTDGTNRGNPVPIEQQVQTWLQDGAIVVTQGHTNREVPVRVRLTADTLPGVGAAEKALFGELEKPNTMSWTPNVAMVRPVVFVIITSRLDHLSETGWDTAEVDRRPSAKYQVTLTCEAFVRSDTETITPALPATGTTTTPVNDGSVTTNWTGQINGTSTAPSVVSGAVKVTNGSPVQGSVTCSLIYTASINTSSTKYLQIDWKPESNTGSPQIAATADGVPLTKVAETASPTAGFTRTWFGPVAASSIAVLRIDSLTNIPTVLGIGSPPATRSLYVDNINRTDEKPSQGSGRQLLRRIAVGGSARTPGSVAIEHASSALGDVLAYFYRDVPGIQGYSPSMRPHIFLPGTTDATLVSGARTNLLSGGTFFLPPVSRLPAGRYLVVARIGGAGGGGAWGVNLAWNYTTTLNGPTVGPAISRTKTLTLTSAYTIFVLDRVTLPTCDLDPASPAVLQILFTGTAVGTTTAANLDDLWLYNLDIGQLVRVSCGTGSPASGGPANRVFIEPASTDRPRPSVRIGFAADKSDSFYPATFPSWQFPQFVPPSVIVHTVTTNAVDAAVSFRNWDRFPTFRDS